MKEVSAPVAGSVWRVMLAEGSSVSEGDEIVILESMKMEIPVESPSDGTLARLLVQEGSSVDAGDPIAFVT
jgi:acetyl-CoA carboxylase biotin carboxyl carrier protein